MTSGSVDSDSSGVVPSPGSPSVAPSEGLWVSSGSSIGMQRPLRSSFLEQSSDGVGVGSGVLVSDGS